MLTKYEINDAVDRALSEDLHAGDLTTDALIPPSIEGRARIVSKEQGVLAGIDVARAVWGKIEPSIKFLPLLGDGIMMLPSPETDLSNCIVAELHGSISSLLRGERIALNFLQHMSGIATKTSKYVAAVKGHKAKILDTRKTTPGIRALEKYSVRTGGGTNHRTHLGDGILIKDNHLTAMLQFGLSLHQGVEMIRSMDPKHGKIEIEAENVQQVVQALEADADIILLDNMAIDQICESINIIDGRALTEASGGITLENVALVAATGVDMISIGALTHSSKALDFSLEIVDWQKMTSVDNDIPPSD